jgi:putative salt-induced outer membrane protein
MIVQRILCLLTFTLLITSRVLGQAAPPPKTYAGSLGGGIALTGGNTDTKNINLTFNFVRDPKTRNVFKSSATYLRGNQNDVLNLDRTAVNFRDEYTLSGRTFAFGQVDYLRDQFKDIIFLWTPVAGIGYNLVNTDLTKFGVDGGAGAFIERNPGNPVSRSGGVKAGESLQQKISSTAALTEALSRVWKTSDFGDSLTSFNLGLVTSVARKLELKIEFIDSYKNKPPSARVKKNDTAFVTTFVVKF